MSLHPERSGKVEVFCRIKPSNKPGNECLTILDEKTLSIQSSRNSSRKQNIYHFSKIFSPNDTQEAIFSSTLLPCVEKVLNGDNALLFAYGVTGSGKTYTMQGDVAEPGLVPRGVDVIFNSISSFSTPKFVVKPNGQNGFHLQSETEAIRDRLRFDYNVKPKTPGRVKIASNHVESLIHQPDVIKMSKNSLYAVFVSFVELYKNNIHDLLDVPPPSGSLPRSKSLREDSCRNIYVSGIVEKEVKSAAEALQMFYYGQKMRHVGSTALNTESSRSHGIFTIRIVKTGYDENYEEVIQNKDLITVSQLCLVDLAGSERTNRSGTTGSRLKEASTINNSLMNLRKCIEILRQNQSILQVGDNTIGSSICQSVTQVVPYRDSKLTHLFKSYFEGNGEVGILICIHPGLEELDETLHVLQFAEHSQNVALPVGLTPRGSSGDHVHSSRNSSIGLELYKAEIDSEIRSIEDSDSCLFDCISELLSARNRYLPSFCNCRSDLSETCLICSSNQRISESDPDGGGLSAPECERQPRQSSGRRSSISRGRAGNENDLSNILNKRTEERARMRALLLELDAELQSNLSNIIQIAERKNSNLSLMDTLDALKMEKLQMESKIRHLQNEIAKHRLSSQQQQTDCIREIDKARVQIRKLQTQLAEATPLVHNSRRSSKDPKSSSFGKSTHSDLNTPSISPDCNHLRNDTSKPSPKSNRRVATIARQWESRILNSQKENKVGVNGGRSRTANVGSNPLNTIDILNRPGPFNPRHRRSRSVGNKSVWLEHKEMFAAPLGTVLTPCIKARKSTTQIELNDTLSATDYLLHHQTTDASGNIETKLFKGAIIPTAGGGSSVIFNDVEELRQASPLSSNERHSLCRTAKHARSSIDDLIFADHEDEPIPAKRRVSSRYNLRSSDSREPSVPAIDDDDAASEASSYQPITSPCKLDTCFGIGFSSNGGISHTACREQ